MKDEDKQNPMRNISIEKIALSVGGTGDDLEKGAMLLKILTERTPSKMRSKKRIPSLGVRPGLEVGAVVTIRKEKNKILERMLTAIDRKLRKKQVTANHFSFGIKEYIEIPGIEYQRNIGVRGLNVTVVFKRSGRRVSLRKVKKGKIPRKQDIPREEIIKFMEEKFGVTFR